MWSNVWLWTFKYKDLQQVNVVTRFSFATDNDEENNEFFICTMFDDLATGLRICGHGTIQVWQKAPASLVHIALCLRNGKGER